MDPSCLCNIRRRLNEPKRSSRPKQRRQLSEEAFREAEAFGLRILGEAPEPGSFVTDDDNTVVGVNEVIVFYEQDGDVFDIYVTPQGARRQ